MIPWILIGSIAALLTMFGFVPQIVKMYRTKLVHDVSVITLFQFSAGVFLWAVYGYAIGDPVVIVANIVSLATLVVALGMYYHYRRTMKTGTEPFIRIDPGPKSTSYAGYAGRCDLPLLMVIPAIFQSPVFKRIFRREKNLSAISASVRIRYDIKYITWYQGIPVPA